MVKATIDKLDIVLGKCHDYTRKELDLIINFGIKYRFGQHTPPDN